MPLLMLVGLLVGAASVASASTTGAPASAPINTVRPMVTGTPRAGATLTATTGSWTPAPDTYETVWQACIAGTVPLSCRTIGIEGTSVTLADTEIGKLLRVRATATNATASKVALSPLTKPVTANLGVPPSNTTRPSISGYPVSGVSLTVEPGQWANTPTDFRYQWQKCVEQSPGRTECVDVRASDAGAATFTPDEESLRGVKLRVRVTATNAAGEKSALTALTRPVDSPTNATPPRIIGTPRAGVPLKAYAGDWVVPGLAFTFTWQACTTNPPTATTCAPIPDDGSFEDYSSTSLTPAEVGKFIRVIVTGTNEYGERKAISAVSAPVVPRVTSISAGSFHNCATISGGTVRCWGSNAAGQTTPPADLGTVTQVDAGGGHSCAVTSSQDVRCWGSNSDGQVDVPEALGAAAQVATGDTHTCALTVAGAVFCWGSDGYGQTDVPADLGTTSAITAGGVQTCAISNDGVTRCWGGNGYGQTRVPGDLGGATSITTGVGHTCAITISGGPR